MKKILITINWVILLMAAVIIAVNIFYMILNRHVDILCPMIMFKLNPPSFCIVFEPTNAISGHLEVKVLNYALICLISAQFEQLSHLYDLLYFLNIQTLLQQIHSYGIPGLNPVIDQYNAALCYQTSNIDYKSVNEALFRILTLIVQTKVNQNDQFLLQRFEDDRPLTQLFLRCVIANLRAQKELFL